MPRAQPGGSINPRRDDDDDDEDGDGDESDPDEVAGDNRLEYYPATPHVRGRVVATAAEPITCLGEASSCVSRTQRRAGV